MSSALSGNKAKKSLFRFALHSVCTNFYFVQVRLHLSSTKRKSPSFALHCIRFALTLSPNQPNTHYIPDHELVNNAF